MTAPARILTVCTGNICRSPYLERRLQQALDAQWGTGAVEVSSAGTGAVVGAPIHPLSLERLEGLGGRGDDFAARQLTRPIVEQAQLVVVAAREHRTKVTRLFPRALNRTHTLLDLEQLAAQVGDDELATLDTTDARTRLDQVVPLLASKRGLRMQLDADLADVHDPIGLGPEAFEQMERQVEAALPALLRVLGR